MLPSDSLSCSRSVLTSSSSGSLTILSTFAFLLLFALLWYCFKLKVMACINPFLWPFWTSSERSLKDVELQKAANIKQII